jgi:hypothetical protein
MVVNGRPVFAVFWMPHHKVRVMDITYKEEAYEHMSLL